MKLKKYLYKAQKEKWAIGQFNFSTLEQLRGILAAAKKLKSPVILGTSEGEAGFLGLEEIIALVEISKIKHGVTAFLNFDHGKDLKLIKKAIDFGYSAVHFDGSDLSLEENIRKTKEVAEYAHRKGVLAEGELGYIRGESKPHKEKAVIKKEDLTAPELVPEFINKTGVDSLAVAIGNSHGIYSGRPKLDFERLKKISTRLACGTRRSRRGKTSAFLVLHGGSGIADSDIKKAVKLGIVKININTELRVAWRKGIKEIGAEVKPYKVLPRVEALVQKKVEEKIKIFDSNNKI